MLSARIKKAKQHHEAVSSMILAAALVKGFDWWRSLGTIPERYPYCHEHIVKSMAGMKEGGGLADLEPPVAMELITISQESGHSLPPVIDPEILNAAWLDYVTAEALDSGNLDRVAEVLDLYKQDKASRQSSYLGSFDPEQVQAGRYVLHQPPELDYIFERTLLAGTTGVLVGPAGAGKSTLLNQIILSVATGQTIIPEFVPTRPGKVLAIFCEEDDIILHHRMHHIASHFYPPGTGFNFQPHKEMFTVHHNVFVLPAMGHDVRLIELGRDRNPIRTKEFDGLLALAMKIPDLRLIVLDPFSRLYGQNENDPSMTTYFVSLVEHLSAKTGATALLSHHTGKASSTNASNGKFDIEKALHQDAARGSSGIPAAVRWQCNMTPLPGSFAKSEFGLDKRPADGQYLGLKVAKLNYGPPQRPFFLKKSDGGALEPFRHEQSEEDIQRKQAIEVKVYEALAEYNGKMTKRTFVDTFGPEWKETGVVRSKEDLMSVVNMMLLDNKVYTVYVTNKNNRKWEYLALSPMPE